MSYSSEVLADSPAAYYRLGEASGTVGASDVLDSSGNSRHASYAFSLPTLGQPGLIDDTDTCALFAGTGGGGANTSSGVIPNTTVISVEFWIKTTTAALKTIVARDSATSSSKVWLVRTTIGGNVFLSNPVTSTSTVSTVPINDGDIHHVVITMNGLDVKIYIDGALDTSAADWGNLRTTSSAPLYIARDVGTGSTAFQGHLDEVAVYTTELSAARVLAHYTAGAGAGASTDLTIPNVDFTGSGSFAAFAPYFTIPSVDFGGSGTLTGTPILPANFGGDGTLAIGGTELYIPPELTIEILDDTINQAPTPITVVLVEGFPEAPVEFRIDGVLVFTGLTDSDGYLAPTSINVSEELGTAGTHTLTATQPGAGVGSATFTVARAPSLNPSTMGPDAQAVDVPGAVRENGTRRWVFQDLLPGGLGSWIMPKNPTEGPMPYSERQFSTRVTTTGQPHVSEGMRIPVEWTFSGIAINEEFAEKLLAYRNLNRRFYIINHRGQAFKVVLANVELVPRLRRSFGDNDEYAEEQWIDGHDYTVTATVLDQDWVVPA